MSEWEQSHWVDNLVWYLKHALWRVQLHTIRLHGLLDTISVLGKVELQIVGRQVVHQVAGFAHALLELQCCGGETPHGVRCKPLRTRLRAVTHAPRTSWT